MRTKESPCPTCGHLIDDCTCVIGPKDAEPKRGDFTICIECGEILVFESDLTLRHPTVTEMMLIPITMGQQLEDAQRIIRSLRK